MRALRQAIASSLLGLLASAAVGCVCTCPRAAATAMSPSVVRPAYSASRGPSFYDQYKEEKHRRQVEKDLHDIKRNTQRAHLSK